MALLAVPLFVDFMVRRRAEGVDSAPFRGDGINCLGPATMNGDKAQVCCKWKPSVCFGCCWLVSRYVSLSILLPQSGTDDGVFRISPPIGSYERDGVPRESSIWSTVLGLYVVEWLNWSVDRLMLYVSTQRQSTSGHGL
jgi:hypothetical protein